jgi:hypothetical protein
MKKLFFIIFAAMAIEASAQSVAISQIQKIGDKMHVTVVFNNIDSASLGESMLVLKYGPDMNTCCIEEKMFSKGGWQEYMFTIPAKDAKYMKAMIWNKYLPLFSNELIVSPLTCFVPKLGEE